MRSHAINKSSTLSFKMLPGWSLLVAALPLYWLLGQPGSQTPIDPGRIVFWHTLVELVSVVVAMLVFVTGYYAVLRERKTAVTMLAIGFLGVGLLDLLHLLSSLGMPDAFTPNSPQKSGYFWLAARMLAAFTFLAYLAYPARWQLVGRGRSSTLAGMLLLVAGIGVFGMLRQDWVTPLFVAGSGLTRWKFSLEWLVISVHLLTLVILWRHRALLEKEGRAALAFAITLSALSDLYGTRLGVLDQELANSLAHAYKLTAYLYLFHVTVNAALIRPLHQLKAQYLRENVTLNAAPDAILWVDADGDILMANPATTRLTGYTPDELIGRNVDLFLPEHLRRNHATAIRQYFQRPTSSAMGSADLKLMRRDGSIVPVDISLGYWEDADAGAHAIAYVRDLSERKNFEESLRHRATHDELTGLPNRWLLGLQLNQALARAARSGARVAVLFLDLDNFKNINDSFGHAAGDALLVQVGARIRSGLRANDLLARLGGDEFAILLADMARPEDALGVAAKLLASLQNVYQVQGQDVYSGGSLGVSFFPDDASDCDTLLRYADMAMYQAKRAGRGGYACYSPAMDKRVHDDMRLHTRLKEAIASAALRLHYQPKVDVATGAVIGAEALLRWHDAQLGEVPPARFIPMAEATGLILALSDWVLETACRQIAAWERAGTPLRVAVNFSAQHFNQPDFAANVAATLARTGASARLLEVEITESVAMAQPEQACLQIQALVDNGCSVALDDFGTGYSSLAYLKALPVSTLKIDRSFIRDLPSDENDVAISRAIIALAHNLGLTLVAEGVETCEQLAFLRTHGCESYQGWLYAAAMPAEAMTALLVTSVCEDASAYNM
ncbi:MAG: EAL domain-containing protein [Pseudomonadota bacterium]